MDEEDAADAEEARKLQTTEAFAGLGSAIEKVPRHENFMDLFKITGDTAGVKLLKKMGWREGQGVGPKIMREAQLNEQGSEASQQIHLFAPENYGTIALVRKDDRKGLGFVGETRLSDAAAVKKKYERYGNGSENASSNHGIPTKDDKLKREKPRGKNGFGVGIINDDGSDDDDPYQIGPQISYNRVIGGDKNRKKKLEVSRSAANPLLVSKPMFISRKAVGLKHNGNAWRCHDGRLPIDGFMLSSNPDTLSSIISLDERYPMPAIPTNWTSSKPSTGPSVSRSGQASYQSPAAVAAASKLSPDSRAGVLGETLLPGKSVFDYLTPNARTRIASVTNNYDLPPALGEAEVHLSNPSHQNPHHSLIPPLTREIALTALGRGTAGWMPYAEDPAKRARYRMFLEMHAGLRQEGTLPDRDPGSSNENWVKELHEFAHAARIFKPMTGVMAARFTPSALKAVSDHIEVEGRTLSDNAQSHKGPSFKAKNSAEEAAVVGMYGPLTRSVEDFYPTRLLCKRFNIEPPAQLQVDPGRDPSELGKRQDEGVGRANEPEQTHSTALPQKNLELVGKRDMDELRVSGRIGVMNVMNRNATGVEDGGDGMEDGGMERREAVIVDPDKNEALEEERPGESVFKAIFGSDSEDD